MTLLLSHRAISPNGVHPPGSGTTALHLASSLGRTEIVNLLLEQLGIDDTLRDVNGNSCRDVARNKDVKKAIDGKSKIWVPPEDRTQVMFTRLAIFPERFLPVPPPDLHPIQYSTTPSTPRAPLIPPRPLRQSLLFR